MPRIAAARLDVSSGVQAVADEVASQLARVDAPLRSSTIAQLPAVLLRTESASSSQIERLTASAKSLAEAEIGEKGRTNAHPVVANVRAVGPHRAYFVPTHHERVPDAMADMIAFAARTDLPVIAHVASAHAQFETIHPFTDGNGRTGRALMHAMLREAGLTHGSTIPVSAGLLHETDAYFAALTAYREGDVEPNVERVAEAAAWRLAALLPGQPVVTYEVVTRELGVSAPTAYASIERLADADAGVLVPRTANRRDRVWDAPEVLKALDEFADAAKRG